MASPELDFQDILDAPVSFHKMVERKNKFANLLANEGLNVVHGNFSTAMFNLKTRTVLIPLWRNLPWYVYDLLYSHEVGHARFTPPEGYHDAIKGEYQSAFAAYMNISEDTRIERLVKLEFPGLKYSYVQAYKFLVDRGFFGENAKHPHTLEKLLFVDRFNIWSKIGDTVPQRFRNHDEVYFIEWSKRLRDFSDTVKFANDLWEYCKEEQAQTGHGDMSGDGESSSDPATQSEKKKKTGKQKPPGQSSGSGSSGESRSGNNQSQKGGGKSGGDTEPKSETDEAFRDNEHRLNDPGADERDLGYLNLIPFNIDPIIIPNEELFRIRSQSAEIEQHRYSDESEHVHKNMRVSVNKLMQEFERRKAAATYKRTMISRSGALDPKRLARIKTSADVFRRHEVVNDGKNHGLVLYMDWSGSMRDILFDTGKQLVMLVEFCRRAGIDYDVYAFTDAFREHRPPKIGNAPGDTRIEGFHLLELFSSRMSQNEHVRAVNVFADMICHARQAMFSMMYYSDRDGLTLGGTPLAEAVYTIPETVNKLRTRTNTEIVNVVFLTDGGSDSIPTHGEDESDDDLWNHKVIVVNDRRTGKSAVVNAQDENAIYKLVHVISGFMGLNTVNFHLLETGETGLKKMTEIIDMYSCNVQYTHKFDMEKYGCISIQPQESFDSIYLLHMGFSGKKKMNESAEDAFDRKEAEGLNQRKILTHFVGMICGA